VSRCSFVRVRVSVPPPDRNDLKPGTLVVLDTMLLRTNFGFRGARAWVRV